MNDRIRYIDISKGILIICVLLGHIAGIGKEFGGIDNNYFEYTGYLLSTFYVPFYMQAFFFVTGYTSNFNKPFKFFLKQNIKRLLIPYICFGIIYAVFNKVFFSKEFLFTTIDGERVLFIIEYYWFLSTMFIARLLFWGLNKLNHSILIVLSCLILFTVSACICTHYQNLVGTSHWHNWFHYRNALMMLIFMAFGHCFKKNVFQFNAIELWGTIIYLMLFLFTAILGHQLPNNGHGTESTFNEMPLHLFCATTGTLMVFFISKLLFSKGNSFLETMGRNSLTVYTIHYLILETLTFALGLLWQPIGILNGFLFYLIIATLSMPCCYYIALFFKKKPLNYLLGAF